MKVFFLLSFFSLFLLAQEREKDEPFFDDTYYIKLWNQSEITRKAKKQIELGKREELGLVDISISLEPLLLPIKDISKLSIHESKNPTIIFPQNTLIMSVTSFPKGMVGVVKDYNTFEVFPSPKLVGGNITVRYMVNNNLNDIRIMKINIEKFINLKSENSIYYPMIKYYFLDDEAFTWENILESYRRLKGHYPRGSVFFELNGVGITLIEDNINGNQMLGNKKFRVLINNR